MGDDIVPPLKLEYYKEVNINNFPKLVTGKPFLRIKFCLLVFVSFVCEVKAVTT